MKKKNNITTIILVILLLIGVGVIVYPTFSNWWNDRTQSKAIANYQMSADNLDDSAYEKLLEKAREYNEKLSNLTAPLLDYKELSEEYNVLDVSGSGVIGYITVPQLNIQLPVYCGTSEEVLNVAIGHLQGSSLPVGGESTHAVVVAHRGLPSAKLFSDLDKLVVGDEFTITILNETFTYQVDEINIVLPDETQKLNIIKGEDHVTLVTCTPYGINSHRLLVRARRIEPEEEKILLRVPADATQVDPMLVVPFIVMPLVIIMIIVWTVGGKKKSLPANPLDIFEKRNNSSERTKNNEEEIE